MCETCSTPLRDGARSDARYCSTRCRQSAWREQRRRDLAELARLRTNRAA